MRVAGLLLAAALGGFAGGQTNLEALASELGGPKSRESERELIRAGKAAVPWVAPKLNTLSPEGRIRAAHVLGRIGDEEAVRSLTEAAKAGPKKLTDEAVLALCRINHTEAVGMHGESRFSPSDIEPFKEIGAAGIDGLLIALRDRQRPVREIAVEGLNLFRDPKMIEPLAEYLVTREEWGLWTCADILADFDDPRALTALAKCGEWNWPDYGTGPVENAMRNGHAFKEAIRECFKNEECVPFLVNRFVVHTFGVTFEEIVALAKQKDKPVHAYGYRALGMTGSAAAVPHLRAGLSRDDSGVREALWGLIMVGPRDPHLVNEVIGLYGPDDVGKTALQTAARLANSSHREFFLGLLKDATLPGDRVGDAIRGVSKARKSEDLALIQEVLMRDLKMDDWSRESAASSLASYGEVALPVMKALSESKAEGVKQIGVMALDWHKRWAPLRNSRGG